MRHWLLLRRDLLHLRRGLCTVSVPPQPHSRVFLDIKQEPSKKRKIGRLVIELREDLCPAASKAFQRLCTGEYGISYKGSPFHLMMRRVACWGGEDFSEEDLDCVEHRWPGSFTAEFGKLNHDKPGVVSLANCRWGRKATEFSITFTGARYLDDQNVAFGQVVEGLDVLRKMEKLGASLGGNPVHQLVIVDCGLLDLGQGAE